MAHPYSDTDDLRNLELTAEDIVELTDDDNLDENHTPQVDACIARGDAEIDKYCSAYYTVPFVVNPDCLTGWSATLAAFYLYRNLEKPTTLIDRYNKTLSDLKKISEGDLKIPGAEDALSTGALPGSTTDGQGHEFTRGEFDDDGNQVTGGSTDVW